MNLKNISDDNLLSLTQALVKEERETTAAILHYLSEIGRRRLYAKVACSSLFDYCVRVLGYSEAEAQRRITAARLMEHIPDLDRRIENGILTLTVISHAQRFFNRENSDLGQKIEILQKLERQTGRNAERILAALSSSKEVPRERIRSISEETTELRVAMGNKLRHDLFRLRDIWKLASFQEVLEKMTSLCLARVDPIQKAQRNASIPGTVKFTNSRYIAAATRHTIWLRGQGRCTFTDGTRTCNSTYRLEIDHIKPFAKGGDHSPNNLRLRCFTHNQLHARDEFGEQLFPKK